MMFEFLLTGTLAAPRRKKRRALSRVLAHLRAT